MPSAKQIAWRKKFAKLYGKKKTGKKSKKAKTQAESPKGKALNQQIKELETKLHGLNVNLLSPETIKAKKELLKHLKSELRHHKKGEQYGVHYF